MHPGGVDRDVNFHEKLYSPQDFLNFIDNFTTNRDTLVSSAKAVLTSESLRWQYFYEQFLRMNPTDLDFRAW